MLDLSYFPYRSEIKEDYYDIRKSGKTREETLALLCAQNENEINDPDDGAVFWVAVGEAQCRYREVTEDVAQKAKAGLDYLMQPDISLSKTVAKTLCAKLFSPEYRQAPKERKPAPINNYCTWAVGDVYAFPMRSKEAKDAYLDDTTLLIRVKEFDTVGKKIYPVIYKILWLDDALPSTTEELNRGGYLVNHLYARKDQVFDLVLCINSKKQFEALSSRLTYAGNFPDALNPPKPKALGEFCLFFEDPDELERRACFAFHQYGIEYFK